MKDFIKKQIKKIPYIKNLITQLDLYRTDYYPGHYYSPIVSIEEIKKKEGEIFSIKDKNIPGIDLNEDEQIRLLHELAVNYDSITFKSEKQDGLRYYYNNNLYSYSDAIFLNLVIRHFKPKSIIEIGSGYSSAVMLDTNDIYFDHSIKLTFIEPYPERLYSLFKPGDFENHTTIVSNLQDTSLDRYKELNENDILFIDSTHVSKANSDVNKIFFEILPILKKGVLVHFHDIFYPFEYPKEWVLGWKGFGWNEDYVLRAFLMYNGQFKIRMFNTFLEHFHEDWFKQNMPDCLKNTGGSIWLQKC